MASGPQSKSGATKASSGPGFSGDFTKIFSEMKLPAMPDMEAFIAANRRNIETRRSPAATWRSCSRAWPR
jgi:hypothetical protein